MWSIQSLSNKLPRHTVLINLHNLIIHFSELPCLSFCVTQPFFILDLKRLIPTRVCQFCGSRWNPTAVNARFFYYWTGLLRAVDLFTACFFWKKALSSGSSTRRKYTCRVLVEPWSWKESLSGKEGALEEEGVKKEKGNKVKILFINLWWLKTIFIKLYIQFFN